MILSFFILKKGKKINILIFVSYLIAFKVLFSTETITHPIQTITSFSKTLFIPLLLHFSLNYINKYNINKYFNFLKTISIYMIISSIPFLMGYLEANKQGYELERYGGEGEGFVGFFQNTHSANISIAVAIIFLLFSLLHLKEKKNNLLYILILILALYTEYKTYAKTGFLLLIITSYFIFFKNQNAKRKIIISFALLVILPSFYFFVYKKDKVLQMRIQDKNVYSNQDYSDFKRVGSGRLWLSYTNFKNWMNADVISIIFGLGPEKAKDLMKKDIGLRVISHNGYVDAISYHGLLGFFLLISFLVLVFRKIKKNYYSKYNILAYSLFFMYIIVLLTQGNNRFFLDLFFSLIFMISVVENKINLKKRFIKSKENILIKEINYD